MKSLSDRQYIKYASHILLPQMGEAGQLNLIKSRVLIIGIGGLGHSVAHQLAAAGVGEVMLMDDDNVELSNLPRQLLFSEADIGSSKVSVAKVKLAAVYGDTKIESIQRRFSNDLISEAWVSKADLIFDCTDNFDTRLKINRLCINTKKPLISAAISVSHGQLICLSPQHPQSGCYQCLYPENTLVNQSCSSSGVMNSAVISVASMQSLLGLNLLRNGDGANSHLSGILHLFNADTLQWRQVQMNRDPECDVCKTFKD
ncbi:HesA/MoeB/ThiF family protein [Shewanella donghaensis]|uniref:HesA/MoeB/ThiF family protein n=1 Tax=Shewanella donghaensis TaxID=238836 RepID=UPI0013156D86|nr:HesA/MoeB/ThiF family protein [Shewanella donghaensis]